MHRYCRADFNMSAEGTAREWAKGELHESERLFQAIFFQAAVGIAQANVEGEFLLLNDRFCDILGYTPAELRGKTSLILPTIPSGVITAISRLIPS